MKTVLCLLIVFFALDSAVWANDRPNVILFLVDDMGWMDSTPYGSRYYETPNMQRFAGLSMRFTDAYALPLCSPTRASILTGQHSARHGVTSASGHQPAAAPDASRYPDKASPNKQFIYANSKNYLDLETVSLAEVLKEAGYTTAHIGKWHLGLSQEHWPDQHGFDVAFHAQPSPGPPNYFSPYGVHPDGKPSGRHHVGTITDGPDGEYITDRLTDEAIAFVEQNRERPFFLNFWHYGVHGPWGHKEEYTTEFARKNDPRGKQRNPIMASMLKSVDESLGRLMERLDQLELTDNTLFIFYSDNGGNTHSRTYDDPKASKIKEGHPQYEAIQDWRRWAGGEPPTNNYPLREGKGRIYEGGQRVPLMVRWPGRIEPGSTSDAVVGPIDLYPTLLDALNLDTPENHVIDGESLLPVLEQTGKLKRTAYVTWFPHLVPAVSVRQGDWKLIHRFEQHGNYREVRELYNLKDDIGETKNLARAMPEKVRALDAIIDRFVKQTGALAPIPNPAYAGLADPMEGLVPRGCKIAKIDGAIRVIGEGRFSFLGTGQAKLSGPIEVELEMRSEIGGEAQITWKHKDQNEVPEDQSVTYAIKGGESWQMVRVELPIETQPQIVRIYLPTADGPVDIKSIRFSNTDGRAKRWDFSSVTP